jgi:hypothetical protein
MSAARRLPGVVIVYDVEPGYNAALARYGPLVAEDSRALIESSKASLISGELQVFRGPIVDNTGKVRWPTGRSPTSRSC